MNEQSVTSIYNFIETLEAVKKEPRFAWLSDGSQENIATHSWRMALIATVVMPKTKLKIDLSKVLMMIAVHDITEVITGDIPAHVHMTNQSIADKKQSDENNAINELTKVLDDDTANHVKKLWLEYEAGNTTEAIFAKFIDKLEARIQYNQMPKSKLAPKEFDKDFIDKYTTKMHELCQNDVFLEELNQLAAKKRYLLTEE